MANFRPVSNLTFMSEVIERVVAERLNEFLAIEDLLRTTSQPIANGT